MIQPFYKPRPIAPEANGQMRGLRWSLRVSVAGWIVYGAFAYAFADLGVIPAWVQSAAVILGSILIVAGGESNTIATTEAALSKIGTPRISAWDYLAVAASLVGGIMTPLITFSSRQVLLGGWWRELVIQWGPLLLGVAGVFDFYGAVTELSLARRDYVQDLGQWLDEKADWESAHGKPLPEVVTELEPVERQEVVLEMLLSPDAPTHKQIARQLGVSASTIGGDVRALRDAGRLNGRH